MPSKQTYIKDVRLSGYKSIKNVSCEFEEGLNIVIGNNGSGKSNLFEFIYKILYRNYPGLDVFNADINISKGERYFRSNSLDKEGSEVFHWHTEGNISGKMKSFERQGIALLEPGHDVFFYVEFVRFNLPDKIGVLSKELNSKYSLEKNWLSFDSVEENIPIEISIWLRSVFLKENIGDLEEIEKLNDDYVYSTLNDSFGNDFEDVKKNLSRYTPVQDVRLSNSVRIAKLDSSTFEFRNIVFEYKINDDWFSWGALSDGTKRLVYLIFTINGIGFKSKPMSGEVGGVFPITLIEEPELGIHPHQLHLLMNFLRERANEQQIIITTHSPQVLDILGPDELNKIIIAEIDRENGTVLRHLNNEETNKAQLYLKDQGLLSDYWRFSDFQRSKEAK